MFEISLSIGGTLVSDLTKKLKKVGKKNLSILGSCKFRLGDGAKVKFKHDVKSAVEDVKMGILDDILYKENIEVDKKELKSSITSTTLASPIEALGAIETMSGKNAKTQTIVVATQRNNKAPEFDMLRDTEIGSLLRTTFLPAVYQKVSDKWNELVNDAKKDATLVLYIPNLLRYLDDNTGKIRSRLTKVNLLVVATPSKSQVKNGEPETRSDDEAFTGRIIGDMLDAAIKVGAKDIIFDPFRHNHLKKDTSVTSNCWKVITTTQRVLENIDSIVLACDGVDENFITLNSVFNR